MISVNLAREILDERHALVYRGDEDTWVSLVGDAELRRVWRESVPDYYADLADYLNTYTSAVNITPLKFVDNPMASDVVYEGRWRQAYVREYVDNQGDHFVMQILRKGYIESLVEGSTLDWSEARLQVCSSTDGDAFGSLRAYETDNNTPQEFLTVVWNNVSPYAVETIKQSIADLTYNSFQPVVRDEDYEAGWIRLFVASKIEDDGSATITLFLANPRYNLEAYSRFETEEHEDVIYLYSVPGQIAQNVLESYKAEGRSASVSAHDRETGLCDIVIRGRDDDFKALYEAVTERGCMYVETTYFYWGYSKTDMDAIVSVFMTSTTDGTVKSFSLSSNGDGTYNFRLSARTAQAVSYLNVPTDKTFGFTETTSYYWNSTQTDMNNAIVAFMAAAADGERRSVNISKNSDCTYNFQLILRQAGASNTTTVSTGASCLETEETTYYWGYTKSAMEAAIGLYMASHGDGEVKRSDVRYNANDGTFDFQLSTRDSLQKVSWGPFLAQEQDNLHVNRTEYIGFTEAEIDLIEPTDPAAQGTVVSFSKRKNRDCSWDATLDVETIEPQAWTAFRKNQEVATEIAVATGASAEVAEPAVPADNVEVAVDNEQDKYGTFTTRETTETFTKVETGAVVTDQQAGHETTSVKGRHLTSAEVAADYAVPVSPTDGTVVQVDVEKNAHGTHTAAKSSTIYSKLDKGWVSYDTDDGTVRVKRVDHATLSDLTTDIAALDTDKNNSVSLSNEENGLISYTITESPLSGNKENPAGTGSFWPTSYWDNYEDEIIQDPANAGQKLRLVHYYHYGSMYSSNKADIIDFLGGDNAYGQPLQFFVKIPSTPVAGSLWYCEGAYHESSAVVDVIVL